MAMASSLPTVPYARLGTLFTTNNAQFIKRFYRDQDYVRNGRPIREHHAPVTRLLLPYAEAINNADQNRGLRFSGEAIKEWQEVFYGDSLKMACESVENAELYYNLRRSYIVGVTNGLNPNTDLDKIKKLLPQPDIRFADMGAESKMLRGVLRDCSKDMQTAVRTAFKINLAKNFEWHLQDQFKYNQHPILRAAIVNSQIERSNCWQHHVAAGVMCEMDLVAISADAVVNAMQSITGSPPKKEATQIPDLIALALADCRLIGSMRR